MHVEKIRILYVPGDMHTSGMLGEKMSAYEEAAEATANNAVIPEYKG